MKVKLVKVRDYLSKSNLPASDYVINPYIGCPHACKYCYACFMKRFTKHEEEWGTFVDVKQCDKPISLKRLKNKSVFLSSVTDCYNCFEKKYQVTRKILEQLINADCSITISTKSKLILRDIDLLKRCEKLKVAISLNTMDENFRKDMDNASSIRDRLNALKELHEHGIYTVVFMSPIFPYITDFKSIIEKTYTYTDEYWFENLNLRGSYKTRILDYIKDKYPKLYDGYERIYKNGEKSYWVDLSEEIEKYCRKKHVRYVNYFYHEKLVEAKIKA